ncbi:DUF4192 domain-containing protein [Saccharopolyspora cebuensis]|uniref:DUF4192 domain-containing protein n=1 Tax=Saccharopolyspora cebuensis TaxID=418759 RepID=A0ABV4CNE9_9PSEU
MSSSSIVLSSPEELLAAVPHLVGHYPQESLVVITIHDTAAAPQLGVTVRMDLHTPDVLLWHAREHLAGVLDRKGVDELVLVVISADSEDGVTPPHADVVRGMTHVLEEAGFPTRHALWTREIRAGAVWRSYTHPDFAGTLPDPQASVAAAEFAVEGAVTYGSRDELAALVAPPADVDRTARAAQIDAVVDWGADLGDQEGLRQDCRTVLGAIRRTQDDAALVDDELVQLAAALADVRVRDFALMASCGAAAIAAQQLWLTLIRFVPDPEVPDIACLVAFTAQLHGEGGLASVALERAIAIEPDHTLTNLLRRAIGAGIPPEALTSIAEEAAAEVFDILGEPLGIGED